MPNVNDAGNLKDAKVILNDNLECGTLNSGITGWNTRYIQVFCKENTVDVHKVKIMHESKSVSICGIFALNTDHKF